MIDTILAIDTGSSSMRGILFDTAGNILFREQRKYTMTIDSGGAATMEAQLFADTLRKIAKVVSQELNQRKYNLLGISLDSQRSSVLAVDRDIHPIYPILMWYDKRCTGLCQSLSPDARERIYQLCGMHLTPVSSAPKMLWMKQNLPDIYHNAYKLMGIHDYLLYLLTGRLVTDAGCACRSALMDIHTGEWSQELLSIFSLDREKLCDILPSGSPVGNVTEAFSAETGLPRVPVISAGGDQQCCILGQGMLEKQTISVNSGSATYLAIPVDRPVPDPEQEVNLSAYFAPTPWVLECSNMGTGTIYQWFNRIFYGEEQNMTQINREVAAQPPGCDGLVCYPDFAGRGCPNTDPDARGLFLGIGLQHTRGSFARAVVEGICFDICLCISHMEELGVPVHRIRSTGGMTNFPEFNQILADISDKDVQVCHCSEATATGAFYAACHALGLPRPHVQNDYTRYSPDLRKHSLYRELAFLRRKPN